MRTQIAVLSLLAACGGPPTTVRVPVPQVAAAPPDAALVDQSLEDAASHVCMKTAWPYPGEERWDNPPEPYDGDGDGVPDPVEVYPAWDPWADAPDKGVCDVRKRHDLEGKLAGLAASAPATAGAARAWDRKTKPAYRELVGSALAITAAEEAQLARDGFVVPERLAYDDYTAAYYDIHRGQLPVYVSADSIMHAVYMSHDYLLQRIELSQLAPKLDRVLAAMHCALSAHADRWPTQVARDVDVYLTVARQLLAPPSDPDDGSVMITGELGPETDAIAKPIVDAILAAGPKTTVVLFGRERALDPSAFTPRGHYADGGQLEQYFRGAMWVSRIEMNLVSRDNRSSHPGYAPERAETPEEALVALALAELATTTNSLGDIAALDRAWTSFAGRREDISFAKLGELRKAANIVSLTEADAPQRLRAVIGNSFQRTVNVHPNAAVPKLAAIATLIGPRITTDLAPVHALLGERGDVHRPVELGFMLGHDRAATYAARDPETAARMTAARTDLDTALAGKTDDLYTAWLGAIRALAVVPAGAKPAFMDTPAYADLRLDGAIAAFGQLRHNHVLVGAQEYEEGGCEIPDGYVEPAVATYRALIDYATRGKAMFAALDPQDASGGAAYFTRLEKLMRVLVALANEELANRPLSADAKRFLAMIVEQRVIEQQTYTASFPKALYNGWYLDLFPSEESALHPASFMADYATFDRDGHRGIHYLGAKGPRLGLFVVDTGGAPRLMVGPVAHAMVHTGPLDTRLTDDAAPALPGAEPWAASYVVKAQKAPAFEISYLRDASRTMRRNGPRSPDLDEESAPAPKTPAPKPPQTGVIHIVAKAAQGAITIDLLDHHFVKLGTVSGTIVDGTTDLKVPKLEVPVEALRVKVGTWHERVDVDLEGRLSHTFGNRASDSDSGN